MPKEKPFYIGHRERLKNRYAENGIDALAEHEILEIILFYSILRVDTKPLAHRLVDKFGSLSNVLSASVESLMSEGLSKNSAVHLKLFSDVSAKLVRESLVTSKRLRFDEMGEFFVKEFSGDKTERVVAALIDSRNNIIALEDICDGSLTYTKVSIRKLAELCLTRRASKIVLAHNHPSGKITPSMNDYMSTVKLDKILSELDIELFENYIVGGNDYAGIKKMNELMKMSGENSDGFDE